MANVTMAMEQMLPEFKDYEKKNLFTKVRQYLLRTLISHTFLARDKEYSSKAQEF